MAVSGTNTFSQTRNQIINRAASILGVKTRGRNLTNEEMNDGSDILNMMVKSWKSKGQYLWKTTEGTLFLVKGQEKYRLDGVTANAAETFYEKTTTLDLVATDTIIPLSDIDNISLNDIIGIKQDDDTIHWTTVAQIGQDATFTENFNDAVGVTFDSNKIEITGGKAQLLRQDDPNQIFNQPFTSSVGFTFDAAKTEFSAGKMQQKDTTPANSVLGATYTSSINASWHKSGSTTGTLNGTPVISGNKLVCTGSQGVYYGVTQDGTSTIKFKYTPNYTGNPPANINICSVWNGTNNNSRFGVSHSPSGDTIRIWLNDSVGTAIYAATTIGGSPSFTAGTTYELEASIDNTAGKVRFFINGTLHGTLSPTPWTHLTGAARLYIGATPNVYNRAEASYEDVVYFDNVQHTVTYTSGYTLNETIYLEDLITLPQFTYSGLGSIQDFTAFATTQTGGQQFNINGQYWNGSAWVASDNTLGQMNSVATINTNITSLAASDTVDIKSRWTASNNQQDTDDLTVTYTGQSTYFADNPTIDIDTAITGDIKGWESFVAIITAAGSDNIKYILSDDNGSSYKYWDGASWVASNGTYSQSNLASEVNTNIPSFPITTSGIKIKLFLHSDDGSTTPDIDNLNIVSNIGAAVVINSGVSGAVTSGSKVFNYTNKITRPEKVTSCRLRYSNGLTDVIVSQISRDTYFNYANKFSQGKPNSYFYDKQLNYGDIYVYPTPNDICDTIKFTFEKQFFDFSTALDDPDFPIEWLMPLSTNLAYWWHYDFGISGEKAERIKRDAEQLLVDSEGYDREGTSIYFQPETIVING